MQPIANSANSHVSPPEKRDAQAWEAAKGFEKAFWSMVLKDMYEESLRHQEEVSSPDQTNVFTGPMADAFADALVEQGDVGTEIASNSIAGSIYEEITASSNLREQINVFERNME